MRPPQRSPGRSTATARHRGAERAAACALLLALIGCDPVVMEAPPIDPDDEEPAAPACIPSGDQHRINSALSGPGAEAVLCQGAVFDLTGPVRFSDAGQRVYTEGRPTGEARALLRVAHEALVTAVDMFSRSDGTLEHVVVDGARPALGYVPGGGALIQAGGSVSGQAVTHVRAYEPRGWTILHLFEGDEPRCRDALVADNHLGPAGHDDSSWADGISLACRTSVVRDNLIVDATDGAIVVFGAPGSLVENNTIRAETRVMLGGINMVDYMPYEGDFTGTRVAGNAIDAAGARIHIGIGMGLYVWVCFDPATSKIADPTLRGAVVTGNTLLGDHMRYGFAVDGVRDWNVTDNVDLAIHSGEPHRHCFDRLASPPAGFQLNPDRAHGTFQPDFAHATLDMALWAVEAPP